MDKSLINNLGIAAAIVLPLFNIPLMIKIIKRRSSRDFSLWWALGVWGCILVMAPSGFTSADPVWRVFNISNCLLFSCVVIVVLKYRKEP